MANGMVLFQSSPAPSGRCNGGLHGYLHDRCSAVSILTGPFGPVQPTMAPPPNERLWCFNPHRPLRAGATRSTTTYGWSGWRMFQSSPAPSGRCNVNGVGGDLVQRLVSILTGPFGPVQPKRLAHAKAQEKVSILTGPFGPVQPMSP